MRRSADRPNRTRRTRRGATGGRLPARGSSALTRYRKQACDQYTGSTPPPSASRKDSQPATMSHAACRNGLRRALSQAPCFACFHFEHFPALGMKARQGRLPAHEKRIRWCAEGAAYAMRRLGYNGERAALLEPARMPAFARKQERHPVDFFDMQRKAL